jgi:hypothetical protein
MVCPFPTLHFLIFLFPFYVPPVIRIQFLSLGWLCRTFWTSCLKLYGPIENWILSYKCINKIINPDTFYEVFFLYKCQHQWYYRWNLLLKKCSSGIWVANLTLSILNKMFQPCLRDVSKFHQLQSHFFYIYKRYKGLRKLFHSFCKFQSEISSNITGNIWLRFTQNNKITLNAICFA